MGKALSYTWRVVVNVFYVLVVLFVFAHIEARDTKIIVAILGLIYVTVRSIAIGQYLQYTPTLIGLAKGIDEIKDACRIPRLVSPEEYKAADEALLTMKTKAYIEAGFLSIIGLFCLFELFSAL